ncbi:MAG: hypothetical protein V2A73_12020, partial [Pseudomonadota bacterium]
MRLRPRAKVVALTISGVVLLLASIALLWPRAASWIAFHRFLPAIERKLGARIEVGSLRVGFGKAVLDRFSARLRDDVDNDTDAGADASASASGDLDSSRAIEIARIDVRFEMLPALLGEAKVHEVVLDRPRIEITVDSSMGGIASLAGGQDNDTARRPSWDSLIELLCKGDCRGSGQ